MYELRGRTDRDRAELCCQSKISPMTNRPYPSPPWTDGASRGIGWRSPLRVSAWRITLISVKLYWIAISIHRGAN